MAPRRQRIGNTLLCSRCGQRQSETEFSPKSKVRCTPDDCPRHSHCRNCRNQVNADRVRRQAVADPAGALARRRPYYEATNARRRERRRDERLWAATVLKTRTQALIDRGWTVTRVATALRTNRTTVRRWLRGEQLPKADTAARMIPRFMEIERGDRRP